MAQSATGSPGRGRSQVRILVLWSHLSGYMAAALRELALQGTEVTVCYLPPSAAAPFLDEDVKPAEVTWIDSTKLDVAAHVRHMNPDLLVVCGWHISEYVRAARGYRGPIVMTMDNPWLGSPRQRAATMIAPFRLRWPRCVFLPGERQRKFALRLGFRPDQIFSGSYTADETTFDRLKLRYGREFLFCGRLVEQKGVRELAAAYLQYRCSRADPWALTVVGTGPLRCTLEAAGADCVGFASPRDVSDRMLTAGALVLPSLHEPWGVIVHEAAYASLPLILSGAVGAGDQFLRHGENGLLVGAGSVEDLVEAFLSLSAQDGTLLARQGRRSHDLAAQTSTKSWASTLISIGAQEARI